MARRSAGVLKGDAFPRFRKLRREYEHTGDLSGFDDYRGDAGLALGGAVDKKGGSSRARCVVGRDRTGARSDTTCDACWDDDTLETRQPTFKALCIEIPTGVLFYVAKEPMQKPVFLPDSDNQEPAYGLGIGRSSMRVAKESFGPAHAVPPLSRVQPWWGRAERRGAAQRSEGAGKRRC